MRAMRRGGDFEVTRQSMGAGRRAEERELRLEDRQERLRAAVRLLVLGSVGKPWNAIYSRLMCSPHWAWARRDPSLLRDAIGEVAVMPTRLQQQDNQLVVLGPEGGGSPLRAGRDYHVAYVDERGIIRRSPPEPGFSWQERPKYRELGDGTLLAQDKGIWYRFMVKECSHVEDIDLGGGRHLRYGSKKQMWQYHYHRQDPNNCAKQVPAVTDYPLRPEEFPFEPQLRHVFIKEPGKLYRVTRKQQIGKADLFKLGLRPKPRRALTVA